MGIVVLAALAALAARPAGAGASQKIITSASSPLSSIYIDNDLACQVQASGDEDPSFYGGTEPGACGTFLALTKGEDVEIEGNPHTFGPEVPPGVVFEADYTSAGEQLVTGTGTPADPFTITTHVYATESGVHVVELTETDSYVSGQESYETTVTADNLGAAALEGTLYHVGDCFLANVDQGYGALNVPSAGSVACTIEPNDSPAARFMAFTPVPTEGFPVSSAHYVESIYGTFWEDITASGQQLPDTIAATTFEDNGMGLSWPIKLAGSDSPAAAHEATLKFATTVSPSSPPTSSSSAGACVPSGQVPVTVSAVDGAKAVDYVLDGAPTAKTPTNAAGQATISLSPGQHTLEYWGEDLAGHQESPRHVLSVTVASGGPSLTIKSEQGRSGYEVGEAASVSIVASGPGLTSDPTAAHVPISTTTPGTFSVARSAANACGTTTASFSYTVIPPPVLGKTANVDLVSGKVYVAVPSTTYSSFTPGLETAVESLSKGLKFVPLTEARQVPIGSTLETTAGVARITTATGKGKTQSGEFGAGIFKLLQNRKQKGLTEMNIIDNRSSKQVCASVGKKAQTASKHLSSKTLGRLTGSAHGSFTTKGQYSAATVRGTQWGVINQCDGTLTKVTRGVVVVRDFRKRKTITLFTGQTYLAKAPL